MSRLAGILVFLRLVAARREALAACVLVIAMVILHATAGFGTSGMPDLLRDLYWAEAILSGEALPLRGPPIYDTIELGPWWYYLMALALAASQSLAGAAAVASILAATKYWLAWRLGRRLGDETLGCYFVIALVVPGWSAAPLGFPTHTALIESALLALALATIASRERFSLQRALWFGLVAAFCIHAHPSTLALIAGAGLAVLSAHRSVRGIALMAISALVAIASLLPPLVARNEAAVEMGTDLVHYAIADFGVDPASRVFKLVAAVALGGGWHGMLLLTKIDNGEWLALVVQSIATVLAIVGISVGLRSGSRVGTYGLVFLGIFFVQAMFLALIRPITPVWMMSTLIPSFAFALACGWRSMAQMGRTESLGVHVSMVAYLLVGLSIFQYFIRELDYVRVGNAGNVFMDASVPWSTSYDTVRVSRVRIRQIEKAAHVACAGEVLHGDLAMADETSLGLPSRRACGEHVETRYGGTDTERRHLAGYLPSTWCRIGLRPTSIDSGFGLSSKVIALAPKTGSRAPRLTARQVDAVSGPLASAPKTFNANLSAGAVVALTGKHAWLHGFSIVSVQAQGRDAKQVYGDLATRFYRCDACSGDAVPWKIEVIANEGGIDFVGLHDDPGGVNACMASR